MMAIILTTLQILLLLLRAHYNRNEDQEKAIQAVREAQGRLAELAHEFEMKLRYGGPRLSQMDQFQDSIDTVRKEKL